MIKKRETEGKRIEGKFQRRFGLTLIELLVVIGIIAVLAGILWVVLAPGRERAWLLHCVNNFKQIHLALEAYRQDWDGVDVDVANSFEDLGLPPNPSRLIGRWPYMEEIWLIGSREIWWCPKGGRYYGYQVSFNPRTRKILESAFRKRRGEYPIIYDRYHNPPIRVLAQKARQNEDASLRVIVLRLNGKVEVKYIKLGGEGQPLFPPSEQW